MKIHIKAFFIVTIFYSSLVVSAIQNTIFDTNDPTESMPKSKLQNSQFVERRFRQHEDNSLLLDYFNGDKIDQHIHAKLSIAYLLTNPNIDEYGTAKTDWNLAFSASVEFDFYMNTRHSGPVVGRRYNPGLQYYFSLNNDDGWQEYRFSVEHESNGQSTESLQTLNSISADFYKEYADDKSFSASKARSMAEETISMGNNFISLGGVYRFRTKPSTYNNCNNSFKCFDIHFKLRDNTFITDENSGNFRSLAALNQNLSSYQGTRISFVNSFELANKHKVTVELSYITGQLNKGKPGEHNTLKANIYYNLVLNKTTIPLLLSCQSGYVRNLYNFAEKKSECTAGFHFIY